MGHYDCKHCGTFGCFGECQTDENQAKAKEADARLYRANKWKSVLRAEEQRLADLEKARAFFLVHDKNGNPI